MEEIENVNPISEENETSTGPTETPAPPEVPEESSPPEAPEEAPIPSIEEVPPAKKEESKARRLFRKFIRWTVGLLIVFGLGFITGIFILYRPATQEIKQGQVDLKEANTQITDLKAQIKDLEGQIESLQALKARNDELLAEQTGFNLHVAILDARLDVASALLALSKEDSAQASIILDKTAGTLDTISGLLEPAQREAITTMAQRLELVLSEMEDDPYAAQSDLDVLATNLLQLEDALFTEP